MNRTASDILRHLEARIARLEGRTASNRSAAAPRGVYFVITKQAEVGGVGMDLEPVSVRDLLQTEGSTKEYYVYQDLEMARLALDTFKKPYKAQIALMSMGDTPNISLTFKSLDAVHYWSERTDTIYYFSIKGFNSMGQVVSEFSSSGKKPVSAM